MVFGDELFNGVIYIHPRPTTVGMATKFGKFLLSFSFCNIYVADSFIKLRVCCLLGGLDVKK